MYVPKGPKPKLSTSDVLDNEFYEFTNKAWSRPLNFPSQKFSKVKAPLVVNYELDEAFGNLDVFGLDNTWCIFMPSSKALKKSTSWEITHAFYFAVCFCFLSQGCCY